MADATVNLFIHYNPRVQTEYNPMMNTWHISLLCCGQKVLGAITQEFLANLTTTPKDITWELFKLFRGFIIDHPFLRQLLMKLTHGTLEQTLSSHSHVYTGYDLKWLSSSEFFPMTENETAWWDKQMDDLDVDPAVRYRFFNPVNLNTTIPDNGAYQYFSGEIGNFVIDSASMGRDPRVDLLPGVHEIVKHPVHKTDRKAIKTITGVHNETIGWTLEMIIIDLNDNHGWTREQVADWVETLDIDIRFRGEDSDEHSRPQGSGVV